MTSVLWGYSEWQPEPIKLSGGTARECFVRLAGREAEGWTCAVYSQGTAPTGLRDLAQTSDPSRLAAQDDARGEADR